jgi:O-antigen biosynthesis rhamnosyltransferase
MSCIVATSPNYVATSTVLAKLIGKVKVIPIGLDKATYPEVESERLRFWRETVGDRFFCL